MVSPPGGPAAQAGCSRGPSPLARRGVPPAVATAFAAGVGASFASTLASVRIIRAVERARSFAPYAAYRTLLAGLVLRRAWQNRSR